MEWMTRAHPELHFTNAGLWAVNSIGLYFITPRLALPSLVISVFSLLRGVIILYGARGF